MAHKYRKPRRLPTVIILENKLKTILRHTHFFVKPPILLTFCSNTRVNISVSLRIRKIRYARICILLFLAVTKLKCHSPAPILLVRIA